MEHLRCVVERITYQNSENGFSVIRCAAKGYHELVTVVGNMPDVHVGSVLSLGGEWRMDAKFGRQFAMETFEETLPATALGIEKYLGSGLIKGIGPKYARKIVQKFGKETLEILEENPDALLSVPGIGKLRVERIKKGWQEQKEIKNIMLFLQGHDVSASHATKIYKTYGNESLKVVQENPYRLADDIWGIGFRTADTIARKLGFDSEKYVRLRSGLLYTLNRLSEDGHCYAVRDQLLRTGAELLEVGEDLLSMTLDEMIRVQDVITEEFWKQEAEYRTGMPQITEPETAIYLPPFFFAESGTAKRLGMILQHPGGIRIHPEGLAERVERKTGMQYDEVQKQAILTAAQSKVLVLTGGPGTGKTTTTLGIITAFREAKARLLLAAPTGRAAKRLSETTGMEAKTIHRLLEFKPSEGYQRKEDNPLEGDVLIVDECSMIDVMLMYNLLKAVPDAMTLILVGDIDQLPSVGAGNVLRDIIDSGCFPVVRLTRIFRQAQTSRIIMNAHRINAGTMPDLRGGKQSDFFFLDVEKQAAGKGRNPKDSQVLAEEAAAAIVEMVHTKLPRYYGVPAREIQVLTPMQKSLAGAANLNQELQKTLNPDRGQAGLRRGGVLFRTNDKVMQIRNNYDKEVFNGDIGIVGKVDEDEGSLQVLFEDGPSGQRAVDYDISELDELVLAYATTIHKAQGSEYPVVVMPVLMSHFVMLQRNLVYTGITRAKKILLIVGTKKALAYAVRNVTVESRNTLLKERLQKILTDGRKPAGTPPKPQVAGKERVLPDPVSIVREQPVDYGAQAPAEEAEKPTHAEWLKIDLTFRLSQSAFRRRFILRETDKAYVREKGMDTIRTHAQDLIRKRLAPANLSNDGRQTPMKGHPVFIGQHATATCCRSCLWKWHGIPAGRELTQEEQDYVVEVLMQWIERQMGQQ